MKINLGPVELRISRRRRQRRPQSIFNNPPYKLHIGPGANWTAPDASWLSVDVDARYADICVNLNRDFEVFPIKDDAVLAIYASHVLEHVSVYRIGRLLAECHRVLAPGAVLRIVVPDPVRSMQEYLNGNRDYPLFARRMVRAKKNFSVDYTLFEALREDFLSRTGQVELEGDQLAHQNAWDFAALQADLTRAGFAATNVGPAQFQKSVSPHFGFEGTYPAEANETGRSMYVEAIKR